MKVKDALDFLSKQDPEADLCVLMDLDETPGVPGTYFKIISMKKASEDSVSFVDSIALTEHSGPVIEIKV
jgi:hypothetical protein